MSIDFKKYRISSEELEDYEGVVYRVFEEEDHKCCQPYDLTKGFFTDLETAKAFAKGMVEKYDVHVAINSEYESNIYDYLYTAKVSKYGRRR